MSILIWYKNINANWKLIIWSLLVIISVLVYYLLTYLIFTLEENERDIPNLIIQIIITILLTFAFISYTFNKNQHQQFMDALSFLVKEMRKNLQNLSESELEKQFTKMGKQAQTENEWVGFKKYPSFTQGSKGPDFYLKYLPTTAYYSFILNGYFGSSDSQKIDDKTRELIGRTYFKYRLINSGIQAIENKYFGYKRPVSPNNYSEIYYSILLPYFYKYGTNNFYEETYNTIKTICDNYPELKIGEGLRNSINH